MSLYIENSSLVFYTFSFILNYVSITVDLHNKAVKTELLSIKKAYFCYGFLDTIHSITQA